jgi:hypothetical protein
MTALFSSPFLLLINIILIIRGGFGQEHSQDQMFNIDQMVPNSENLPGWFQDGEKQYAKGDNLYEVINGGAAIYHEYGFQQAVFLTLINKDEKRINLEICEMDNPECAYGIYSFKTDTGGTFLDIGEDGWLSSYYLNFWKGKFLITITGLDNSKEIKDTMIQIAKLVDHRIQMKSIKPDLIQYLPDEDLLPNGITYFKGLLALFNLYNFDRTNIFNFNEGLHAIYDSYALFLFTYDNADDSRQSFRNAITNLAKNDKYSDFTKAQNYTMFSDEKGNYFSMKVYKRFIIIVMMSGKLDTSHIFMKVEKHIDAL